MTGVQTCALPISFLIIIDPTRPSFLALGAMLGLVLGIIPGIGGLAGTTILLPFTFTMDPYTAFAFLLGLGSTTATGDPIPAVLFGVPGGAASAATVLDGLPMAKRGEAGRALSAAYMSSMLGGIFGAALLAVAIPILRPAILSTVLLLFVRGIESFEVPRLIGNPSRIYVFTTEVQRATSQSTPEFGVASALSMALLFMCVVAVYLYRRATRNAEAYATITGKGYKPVPIQLGAWRWPVSIAMFGMFALTLGLPLLTMV